jgi:predicted glycoside hydrolase/deacetylase ChbG (UPF0249 family)
VHLHPGFLPEFLNLADTHGLPLRGHSPLRYYPRFYGQWDGETHLEHVSVESLSRMLAQDFGEGATELSCHPGYVELEFVSFYRIEREEELRTLCHPAIREKLNELGIKLTNFREFRLLSRPIEPRA